MSLSITDVAPRTGVPTWRRGTTVSDIDVTDPEIAKSYRFLSSPTIRVDGKDVDPAFTDLAITPRAAHSSAPLRESSLPRRRRSRTPSADRAPRTTTIMFVVGVGCLWDKLANPEYLLAEP